MRISDWSSDVCSSDLHVLSLIFGAVIEEAWVKGRPADAIPAGAKDCYAYRNRWTACLFTGPGFPQIDPEKEAKAARMLIEMNLESREELIAQRGRDIEDVFDEIASGSDMAEERDIDLNPALTMAQAAAEDEDRKSTRLNSSH